MRIALPEDNLKYQTSFSTAPESMGTTFGVILSQLLIAAISIGSRFCHPQRQKNKTHPEIAAEKFTG